jgi:hypothetical protein
MRARIERLERSHPRVICLVLRLPDGSRVPVDGKPVPKMAIVIEVFEGEMDI